MAISNLNVECITGAPAETDPPLVVHTNAVLSGSVSEELLEPVPAATIARGEDLARRARKVLGRSLHVRHLDAGSCNGCDWEINATTNAVYDVQRFGIDFVASPRHADVLLVTGTMSRNLEVAARRTYDAMADPRLVIAVGACASSGSPYPSGYASGQGAASILPVDVYVPGCPPRPEQIIEGLLLAIGRLHPSGGS